MNRMLAVLFGVALGAGGTVTAESYALVSKSDVYAPLAIIHAEEVCIRQVKERTDGGGLRHVKWLTRSTVCAEPEAETAGFPTECHSREADTDLLAVPQLEGLVRALVLPAYAQDGFRVAP